MAEHADFRRRAWLLAAELVAGKGEDGEAPALILLVERLQRGILRGETALARAV